MASSLVKIDIHLVFHVKSTGIPMRKEDLPRIFLYIGGVIKGMDGYGAFSVSPSLLDKTINYIRKQEEHHRKRSFHDEYKSFLERYNISYDEKYAFG